VAPPRAPASEAHLGQVFDLDRDLRVRRNNVLNTLGTQTGVNRTFLDQDGVPVRRTKSTHERLVWRRASATTMLASKAKASPPTIPSLTIIV
jgi:hypothetical protein